MQYGLVHIAAGDLLRAEVSAGSENGKRAKEHMEKGLLVPDEIVVTVDRFFFFWPSFTDHYWILLSFIGLHVKYFDGMLWNIQMVKERLLQKDARENGWLLDGYPRSLSQATALENLEIRPDLFIFLDVSNLSIEKYQFHALCFVPSHQLVGPLLSCFHGEFCFLSYITSYW